MTTRYQVFYPSGAQLQLCGGLNVVDFAGGKYPMIALETDEIIILDPRAVIANIGQRTIDYTPRYFPVEVFAQAFQNWLSEYPSWGMPGCLPIEKAMEGEHGADLGE